MDRTKLKNYLEVTTNLAVLLVAMAILSTFAWNFFKRFQPVEVQAGLQRGQKFYQPPIALSGNVEQTLLVAINTTCHYCSQSTPFYNQLAEIQRNTNSRTAIIALFPNSENEVKEYVKGNQLSITTIAATDFNSLNLAGTPTIILLDSSGIVQNFWGGKLSQDEEQEVIKAVSRNKV